MRWLKIFWGEDSEALKKTLKSFLRGSPDEMALMSAIFAAKQLGMNPQGLCRVGSLKKTDFIAIIQKNGRYILHPSNTKIGNIWHHRSNSGWQTRR